MFHTINYMVMILNNVNFVAEIYDAERKKCKPAVENTIDQGMLSRNVQHVWCPEFINN